MENEIKFKLKSIREGIKLTGDEKLFYRSEIEKFITRENIRVQTENGGRYFSPFFGFLRAHTAFTALAGILVFSVSVASAAEKSLPGEYLYPVKTKITEPMQKILSVGSEQKADLAVKFVNKRLKEFGTISVKKEASPELKKEIQTELSSQIKEAKKEIQKLTEENDTSEAAGAANELQSILSAHSIVLEKISADNSENPEISAEIGAEIANTQKIIDDIEEMVESSPETPEFEKSLEKREKETARMLKKLSAQKTKTIQTMILDEPSEKEREEIIGEEEIETELSKISEILEDAKEESSRGKKKKAFKLYNQADQELGQLNYLIETEKDFKREAEEDAHENKKVKNDYQE